MSVEHNNAKKEKVEDGGLIADTNVSKTEAEIDSHYEQEVIAHTPLKTLVMTGFITMLLTLFLCMSLFVYWQKKHQVRVVGVQIDEILADHIIEVGASRMSEQQKSQYALNWSNALDEVIKDITKDGRTVVITKNATIGGVEDLTEYVEIKAKEKTGSINEFGQRTQVNR